MHDLRPCEQNMTNRSAWLEEPENDGWYFCMDCSRMHEEPVDCPLYDGPLDPAGD